MFVGRMAATLRPVRLPEPWKEQGLGSETTGRSETCQLKIREQIRGSDLPATKLLREMTLEEGWESQERRGEWTMLHCSPLVDSPHSEESTCPSVKQEHQQEQQEQCEPGAPLGRVKLKVSSRRCPG